MNKPSLLITIGLISIFLASCGRGGSAPVGSSVVSLTVGGNGRTAILKVERNSLTARAKILPKKMAPDSAVAAIPSAVEKVVFTISGSDMEIITREVLVSGQEYITETFTVPNGIDRRFLVESKDGSEKVLYRGDAITSLDGKSLTLDIEIMPIPQIGVRLFGTPEDDEGYGISLDGSGKVYIAGGTGGSLDGNTGSGYYDAFFAKYNSSLIRQWTRQTGTANLDYAYAVKTDSDGNIYAAGSTAGDIDGNTSSGGIDLFISKYDPIASKLWTKQFGSIGDDHARGMAIDASGNIYAAGYTSGNLYGTNAGGYDVFVVKYDSAGNRLWSRQVGSAGNDYSMGIAVDGSGNVYVTGYTDGSLDGNSSTGGHDIIVVKYDSSGNKQWIRQIGTPQNDEGAAVAVDVSGNIYITGGTEGSMGRSNAGYYDLVLLKLDPLGTEQWKHQYATAGNDYGTAITTDGSGNIYITSGTEGGLSGGYYDILTARYDSNGVQKWTMRLGTTGNDYGTGIALDNSGNVYVTGYTNGNLAGNSNAGGYDIFLVKYNPDGVMQ